MQTVLDKLFETIKERKRAGPKNSYTAQLLADAPARPARKLAEEAVETLIAALQQDRQGVVMESADVLYHLLVVLVGAGVELGEVYAELERREGISGFEEKATRL